MIGWWSKRIALFCKWKSVVQFKKGLRINWNSFECLWALWNDSKNCASICSDENPTLSWSATRMNYLGRITSTPWTTHDFEFNVGTLWQFVVGYRPIACSNYSCSTTSPFLLTLCRFSHCNLLTAYVMRIIKWTIIENRSWRDCLKLLSWGMFALRFLLIIHNGYICSGSLY